MNAPSLKLDEVPQMSKQVKMYPQERWEWGLTTSAEVWNGRIAMIGFLALLLELVSGQGPLHYVGLL
jgi:ferrochelatase